MSVVAEFVGGPLDGELRVMPDGRFRWYFPVSPPLGSIFADTADALLQLPDPLIYERTERRTPDTPTGEPVFRYVLRQFA